VSITPEGPYSIVLPICKAPACIDRRASIAAAISSSALQDKTPPPSTLNWMPIMQGKYCVKRRPLGKMRHPLWLMVLLRKRKHPKWWERSIIHLPRAVQSATLGLQAPGTTLICTKGICIPTMIFIINTLFAANFAVQRSIGETNARRQRRNHFIVDYV